MIKNVPKWKYSLTSLLCQLWDLAESWRCGGVVLEWGGIFIRRRVLGHINVYNMHVVYYRNNKRPYLVSNNDLFI